MTYQQIVDPEQIEPQLLRIWEGLAKENKMRASLFNLIVFTRLSPRTDYFRNIVQKVVEKFPCRILFISHEPDSPHPYLKTAVSTVVQNSIACDQIDIGVAGPDLERVPFLLLPHIIPDLPVYLLWAEDPSQPHPLFDPLLRQAKRLIVDSESADDLLPFAKKLLTLRSQTAIDIADLNWARTEGWRELIASTFDSEERQKKLRSLSHLKILYNGCETPFFCHLKIQAIYLLAWLSSRLKWKVLKKHPFQFQLEESKFDALIEHAKWEKLGPGTLISAEFHTSDGHHFEAARIPDQYHHIKIQLSSSEKCDLPYNYVLGQTATGQSLVKEICTKGTSQHYLEMLHQINKLC